MAKGTFKPNRDTYRQILTTGWVRDLCRRAADSVGGVTGAKSVSATFDGNRQKARVYAHGANALRSALPRI